MRKFLRNNGLSLVLIGFFLLLWLGQAFFGWKTYNAQREQQQLTGVSWSGYLLSSHFWQATSENWESEFLQMGAYVVLTCYLFQKGSAESKDPDQPEATRRHPASFWYRHSLSLAFLLLFLASFIIHIESGWRLANEERRGDGPPSLSTTEWLADPEFWFQSLQNWQSEFLAVLSIVVLSIFLREDGSPESKTIDAPHSKTGN